MSFTNAQQARLLIGVTELSPKLTSARVTQNVEMLDSTTLNDTAKRSVAGLSGGELQVEGWSDAAGHTATYATFLLNDGFSGVNTVVSYAPAGFNVGSPVDLVVARRESSYEVGTQVGALANFSLNVTGDGFVGRGVCLHGITAETADGNGTTYDRGADMVSSANGAVAHIHTTAFSGLTNNIVTIEDSANGSAWATIGTFTTITAVGAQRLEISGTIRRYLRAVTNVTGTGSTTFAVAIAPL